MKDELQCDYYFTLASANSWSVRQLRKEIDGMLYERTALSSKHEEVVKQELANVRDNKRHIKTILDRIRSYTVQTGLGY